jgi:hypothetical protein
MINFQLPIIIKRKNNVGNIIYKKTVSNLPLEHTFLFELHIHIHGCIHYLLDVTNQFLSFTFILLQSNMQKCYVHIWAATVNFPNANTYRSI